MLKRSPANQAGPNVPESAPPTCSPARWVAFWALTLVSRHENLGAMETIAELANKFQLAETDRRLANAIVLAVLRHRSLVDAQIARCLRSPLELLRPQVREILRMVVVQRHWLDRIPAYAMASEAVALAKALGLRAAEVRFTNALARRLASQTALWVPSSVIEPQALAVRWSVPEWIVREFVTHWGLDRTSEFLETLGREPCPTLRVNTLRTSPTELARQLTAAGISCRPGEFSPAALVLESVACLSRALQHPAFAQGLFYVQDEASQLVSHFVDPRPGERILDLCAAPGGKTTHLAELGRGMLEIIATDADPERLSRLRENLDRLGSPGVRVVPFSELEQDDRWVAYFDAVLVDAPCSALGTMRRHPEVRWRLHRRALESLAAIQENLLERALRYVAPHGRLVYATCSPLPRENHDVVKNFLSRHPNVRPVSVLPASLPPSAFVVRDGFFSTWPAMPTLDGFSVAVLQRLDALLLPRSDAFPPGPQPQPA